MLSMRDGRYPCGNLSGASRGTAGSRFFCAQGRTFSADNVAELQRQSVGAVPDNWSIEVDFHFGGFARRAHQLNEFVTSFAQMHGLTLDWVYVAKMMYGIFALTDRRTFEPGKIIVAVITG